MAKNKGTGTIAEHLCERADQKVGRGMSREAVTELMDNEAVEMVESRGTQILIFEDGSSAYEKRDNDWYPYEQYVQCPECEEWREMPDGDFCDICDDCDAEGEAEDEEATALLKSKVSD